MWVYNKNPKWIGNYWCYLSDGNIEKFRTATNGWWRNPKGEHWADTGGRDVIAWWDEPKPKKPDDQSLQLSGGRSRQAGQLESKA